MYLKDELCIMVMTNILFREITHVDELDGVFRVRFDYIKEWKDHNLKFKNLHENIVNSVRHSSLKTLHCIALAGHGYSKNNCISSTKK